MIGSNSDPYNHSVAREAQAKRPVTTPTPRDGCGSLQVSEASRPKAPNPNAKANKKGNKRTKSSKTGGTSSNGKSNRKQEAYALALCCSAGPCAGLQSKCDAAVLDST